MIILDCSATNCISTNGHTVARSDFVVAQTVDHEVS